MPDEQNLLETSLLPQNESEGSLEAELPPEATPEAAPEQSPEIPEVPEAAPEIPETSQEEVESTQEAKEQAAAEVSGEGPGSVPPPPPAPTPPKDPDLAAIEEVLAEDLVDIYVNLPENKKPAFKKKGEEVAAAVKQMVDSGKFQAKKILDLIREWLRMIPGINKFFLEQEAKIKADKIGDFVEAKNQERAGQI